MEYDSCRVALQGARKACASLPASEREACYAKRNIATSADAVEECQAPIQCVVRGDSRTFFTCVKGATVAQVLPALALSSKSSHA